MIKFIKMVLAAFLGCFIVVACLFILPVFFVNRMVSISNNVSFIQNESILKVDLTRGFSEKKENSPLSFLSQRGKEIEGLNQTLSAIRKAKKNKKILGIYIQAGDTKIGYATAEAIRRTLIDFKKSKKFVLAYGENFNQASYYISSGADKIYMNPAGVFDFRGLAVSVQFNRKALKKCGIEMQVYKIGKYKSAVEPYTQDKMSVANREQIKDFLSDIWSTWIHGISKSRKISIDLLDRYANRCLTFMPPDSVVSFKLIDGLQYSDEIDMLLKRESGMDNKKALHFVDSKELASITVGNRGSTKSKIAILYAEGEIISDVTTTGIYYGSSIVAEKYVKMLSELREDPSIKAVVFRINSPGGSAYASEQIWHALKRLQEIKPVVVSMGDYAASGAYYIACGAGRIIAEPTTLTGSIGIFGLIPNGAQLAKQMGITHDHISIHQHANLYGDVLSIPLLGIGLLPARPLNKKEGSMIQSYIERSYTLFLDRVSDGRKKTKEQIYAIADGRIWTGEKAVLLGLVDQLGGMDLALQVASQLSNIKNYSIVEYPQQKDFLTALFNEIFGKVNEKICEQWIGKDLFEQQKRLCLWNKYDYRQARLCFDVD